MQPKYWSILAAALLLSGVAQRGLADADLDAELDQEWGPKRVTPVTVAKPADRYAARLKLLENMRDSALDRCDAKSEGRYCKNYAEESFRNEKRALDAEFPEAAQAYDLEHRGETKRAKEP